MNRMSPNMLIAIIVIGLGVVYAAMHINFVVASGAEKRHVDFQLALADGMHPEIADAQSRILFPGILKISFAIFKKHSWALFLSEGACSIFSLCSFFLLSYALIADKRYALLSVISLSAFTPYALQLIHRYGEPLIIGFYSLLLFFILTEKEFYYISFLAIASFQRPDVALSSVFFKVAHTLFIKRRYIKVLFDLSLFSIPMLVVYIIKQFYHIQPQDYLMAYFTIGFQRLLENLKAFRSVAVMYLPIIILAILLFRSFDRIIRLILLSMVPYVAMVTLFGSYSESRLLLPIFSVLIIAIVKTFSQQRSSSMGGPG